MSQSQQIKANNPITARWLHSLTFPQIKALAHQHGVKRALTRDIDVLRNDLIKLPDVQEIASEFHEKEKDLQTE